MSDLPLPSAVSNVWPRVTGSTITGPSTTGPVPLGSGNPMGLPIVNNPNLPSSTIPNIGNVPPPIPQSPPTPFPAVQQPFGGPNSLSSNTYALPQAFPSYNPMQTNLVPNPVQAFQNEANNRRLNRLEDETNQRRNTTLTLQQMGTHLLQGQMDVQEQVLQYQFMLEQCMETLDHQNFILNGQAEELALLRAKMRNFEYLMDAIRHYKDNKQHGRNTSIDSNLMDGNFLCARNLLSLYPSPGSPFFPGGVTRATSSKFQPFNPRYRSPNGRSSNQNESGSITPSIPNSNTAATRLSRPISNLNN